MNLVDMERFAPNHSMWFAWVVRVLGLGIGPRDLVPFFVSLKISEE